MGNKGVYHQKKMRGPNGSPCYILSANSIVLSRQVREEGDIVHVTRLTNTMFTRDSLNRLEIGLHS